MTQTIATPPEVPAPAPSPAAPALPFAHLNLRRNPFGELDREQRAAIAVVEDLPALVAHLGRGRAAVQFLGEQGRGKSTHLLGLLRHFPGATYVYVGEGERPPLPRSQPLFVDELQRVSRRRRRALLRRGDALAIGSHEDHAGELHTAGYDVITIHPAARLTPAKLSHLLGARIEAARRGPGRIPSIRRQTVAELHQRFGDNVRAIEAHLYDVFQQLREVDDV